MIMMMMLLHLLVEVDDYRFVKLACLQSYPLFPAVLIASWLDLPIGLRILCLPSPSAGRGCLRCVRRLLCFSLLLSVFVLLELLPSHRGHRAYHHQSSNQIVVVVPFVLLLLQSVLVPLLVVGAGVRCLTKLRHNVKTVVVVFLYASSYVVRRPRLRVDLAVVGS